ncbi:COX15/CtaA family protein [Acidocella sp.]|uniref:COX15/CtaA family protein n=1 Tax=Acidocella sp. TaxID=50710 RepID=UPI002601EE70|nr:COX15/CtaA family protein [Acidocella sp.]
MNRDRAVGNWLLLLAFMVFGMTVGGGHARTIGAGFSIQVWRPFTGFIPPLGPGDWGQLYALFQKTAQYQAHPISLAQYKSLFWPMFLDRCWGRLMALVFLIPFAVFLLRRRIPPRLALWLGLIFLAGCAQAAYGWYMVLTGMQPGVVSPPPGWAAPHLLSAMAILFLLLWTGLTLRNPEPERLEGAATLRGLATATAALVWLTMGFGALVATSGALHVFNSFPTMDGAWTPPGLLAQSPLWTNFVTNKATVQFCHRGLATLTALVALATAATGLRMRLPSALRDLFLLLGLLVALQYLLGMATLVLGNNQLGFVHELNAVLLFATAIAARHGLRGAVAAPARALAAAE